MRKTVDVIIPTYKPGKTFLQLIAMLEKQTVPVSRILVMNTEEKYFDRLIYGTKFKEQHRNVEVRHLSRREFDHGKTRDEGARYSDADVFVCLTQDAVPADEHLIEELLKGLEQENVAVAYGRQLPTEDCNLRERFTRGYNYPEEPRIKRKEDLPVLGIKTYFCSDVCAAYDKRIFENQGGFLHHVIFNEDMIYAAKVVKAGYGIAYVPKARVIHSHNYTAGQQFHRNFDLGVSQAEHPEVFADVPSESEGIRLVKETVRFLYANGAALEIPAFFANCGCRYGGYLLGKHYKKLPRWLILKCTMDKNYWK